MKTRKELVLEYMYRNAYGEEKEQTIFTTDVICEKLKLQRTYVSSLLNELVREREIEKIAGRPVKYRLLNDLDAPYNEKSFFASLTGFHHTLKEPIQELKAALVYPKSCKYILLHGEQGVGKSGFAHHAFAYAKDKKIVSSHAEHVVINAYELLEQQARFHSEDSTNKHKVEAVTIEHMELLTIEQGKRLLKEITDSYHHVCIMVAVYTTTTPQDKKLEYLQKEFDFTLLIPAMKQYQLSERFQMICENFQVQSRQLNRSIKIDAVLLKCLLCYVLPGNIGQLYDDIKKGCANGYSRVYHKGAEHDVLFLFIKDFPQYVRKGLLEYAKQSEEIIQLIGEESSFVFDGFQMKKAVTVEQGKKIKVSLTQSIEENTSRLMNMGVSNEEISTMMSVDIISWLQQYQSKVEAYVKQVPSYEKQLPDGVKELVSSLLEKAEKQLSRVYLKTTYDAICLFLSEIIIKKQPTTSIHDEMVKDVAEQCRAEYLLARETATRLETSFSRNMSELDVYYLTLLLLNVDSLSNRTRKKPAVLIVSHGLGTATSISACIRELSHNQFVYGFDLDLEEDLDTAYNRLKEVVLHIDNGKGILMIYDMGSILHMGKMLMDEVDIPIKMIKIPLQLFLLETAKKAEQVESVDKLQEELLVCAKENFSMLEGSYYRAKEHFTIIVLGRVGKSEALQIKTYIEHHVNLQGVTDVVPIISNDREQLLCEVNKLSKESTILCVVGAYDPQLHNIRYLSFSKLLSIPTEKLMFLLYYADIPLPEIPNYREKIETYVKEQFVNHQVEDVYGDIVKVLHGLIKDGVVMNEEVSCEVLLYLTFTIIAGLHGANKAFHQAKKTILSHHKTLYHSVKTQIQPLEKTCGYLFDDHDIANIITMLSRK